MLRVSAETNNTKVDIQGVKGDETAAAVGVLFGAELMRFAEAVVSTDADELVRAREALLVVGGEAVLVDAAGVAANFQRMVRIADSMGIPVDDMEAELGQAVRSELGLERFASARNSVPRSRDVS